MHYIIEWHNPLSNLWGRVALADNLANAIRRMQEDRVMWIDFSYRIRPVHNRS